MKKKNYFYITSFIFLIVGIIHIIRIVTGFEIQIMGYAYPQWLSILEIFTAFYLMIYGYKLGSKDKKIVVRTRGIILCGDELLVVKHSYDHNYYALPGGHMEYGETVLECIEREIIEELGIKPQIGRLLYIHDFIDKGDGKQSVEFFFEILNSNDYKNLEGIERTHLHEIVELIWAKPEGNEILLPFSFNKYFRDGEILSDVIRYIKD